MIRDSWFTLQLWKYLRQQVPHLLVDTMFILLYASFVLVSGVCVTLIALYTPFPPYTTIFATVEQVFHILMWFHVTLPSAQNILHWSTILLLGPSEYEELLLCQRECLQSTVPLAQG